MRLQDAGVLAFERGGANQRRLSLELGAFEPPVGFAETILQHAFEARFSVALLRVPAFFLLDAPLAAAEAVIEQQSCERERGGQDGARAETVPQDVRVHTLPRAPKVRSVLRILSAQYRVVERAIVYSELEHMYNFLDLRRGPDRRILGERVAGLRRASGWTQRELAEVAGVSSGYVGMLERGLLRDPSWLRLGAVARALDVHDADALLALAKSDALEQAGQKAERVLR